MHEAPGPRPTLSVPDAAELLGIPKRTLYDYCQQGVIPHIKVQRKVLLLRATVDAWLREGRITIRDKPKRARRLTDEPVDDELLTNEPW